MCWKVEYIVLIITSTLIDYFIAKKMADLKEKVKRKKWLLISLFSNLGILFGFKYFDFVNDNVQALFDQQFNIFDGILPFELLLPVGISFYTFQTLGYTIDVYNGKTPAQKHLGIFAVYVSFFPQLVAGPIERATHLLPQFFVEHKFSYSRVKYGLQQMLWGFFKKVVIADQLAIVVNGVYDNLDNYSGIVFVIATIFFAFQIYCDFSGYSDIAIGSARVMGFELMDNFKRPYFSKSIAEFWKRWHISLSTWFRDYVYIPLGGNRVLKWRWYYNLFITFLVSGLWHGANWNYIAWGALHGTYLIVAILLIKPKKYIIQITGLQGTFIYKLCQVLITFSLVVFAWIFFRVGSISPDPITELPRNTISNSFYIIKNIFTDISSYTKLQDIGREFRGLGIQMSDLLLSIILIGFMEIYNLYERSRDVWEKLEDKPTWVRWGVYYILLFGILFLAPFSRVSNFIYFEF